jgi:hypothetical protein
LNEALNKERQMNKIQAAIDFVTLPLEDRLRLNADLRPAREKTLLDLIGNPRQSYSTACQPVTNRGIAAQMVTQSVGPFRVTGLTPAIEVLSRIMDEIAVEFPNLHPHFGTAGMLCCRFVRGSVSTISNHSWGTAVDLTYRGVLDPFGDGAIQRALLDIHPIFNRHGFFWGAAFRREDAMHFEASDQLIRQWAAEGRFGRLPHTSSQGLTLGDRGPQIELLQLALSQALGGDSLSIDGIFGRETRAAVIEFQRRNGLPPSGIVTARTRTELGLS